MFVSAFAVMLLRVSYVFGQGVLFSSGHRILFADADGASHFPDLALLQAELDRLESFQSIIVDEDENIWKGGHGLIVGSRAHLVRTEAVVKVRNLKKAVQPSRFAQRLILSYSDPS